MGGNMFYRIIAVAAVAAAPLASLDAAQPVSTTNQPAERAAAPAPPPVDAARIAAAERLFAAMAPDDLLTGAAVGAFDEIWGIVAAAGAFAPAGPPDPHLPERMRLTRAAATVEIGRLVRLFGSEVRSLAARPYARGMSLAELEEVTRFYTSPFGRRFQTGSLELGRHAEAIQNYRPMPDPELLVRAMAIFARIEAETRHLSPPPPRPPVEAGPVRETRSARRERRRRGEPPVILTTPVPDDMEPALAYPDDPEQPEPSPVPAPVETAPADPARLAAARRLMEAMWPDAAFAQPLPLERLADAVLDLPMSSFGPVPPPAGLSPWASVGQAIERELPNFRERVRIVARIAGEELPTLLPLAAPVFRGAAAEIYARGFTVAELEEATRFYQTPAGSAFARQSLVATVDPELARGLLLLAPRAAVEALGSLVRVGQATAHLPPPPAPPPAPKAQEPVWEEPLPPEESRRRRRPRR